MAIRTLSNNSTNDTALRNAIKDNQPYLYAHLVKFEKPKPSSFQGLSSNKASEFTYITDASYNIKFDDGSSDSLGVLNGEQTYIANKVAEIGTVQETTEAKASNMSVIFDGTALGTMAIGNLTFTTSTITADFSFIDAGFTQGDVIKLEASGALNDGISVRIDGFSNSNNTVRVTNLASSASLTASASSVEYNVYTASPEIHSLVLPRTNGNYANYINREVHIYRAHINPSTGLIIGEPFLIFKGIITQGSIQDDPVKSSKVTWSLTSHWGDFVRVSGRLTSDSAHRALGSTGVPDEEALVRAEYASDLGFLHAEKAVNMIATYQRPETRYKTKKRGGLWGLLGAKKLVEYTVMVEDEVDLNFNLSAKYLPVVYGVQKVQGIPIFADADITDPNKVYVAQAICEGEIGGIYDIHLDGQTTICINEADSLSRSSGDAPVLCNGRADRGDVLASSQKSINSIVQSMGTEDRFFLSQWGISPSDYATVYGANIASSSNSAGGMGLQHEESFVFQSPIDASFTIHTGKGNQKADALLSSKGISGSFKIQNDFYEGLKGGYWGPQHQLLDTAYASIEFTISEGETTIPEYEFVVRGRVLDCFNYDYSYPGSGVHTEFGLGDTVTLHRTSDNSQIGSSVQIIDKWSFYTAEGTLDYRFRFSDNPQAAAGVDDFYMRAGNGSMWHMASGNQIISEKGACGTLPTGSISSASYNYVAGLTIVLSAPSADLVTALQMGGWVQVSFTDGTGHNLEIISYTAGSNALVVAANSAQANNVTTKKTGAVLTPISHVKLEAADSAADNTYNGSVLTLTYYDSDDNPTVGYPCTILDYSSSANIALLDKRISVIDTNTTYDITASKGFDLRVSTNPVIQLLDYLTNTRYGKGLSLDNDIDLDSFLQAARDCDTQSTVTLQFANVSATPSIGDVYKYETANRFTFQGRVARVSTNIVNSTTYTEIEFDNVIGKLGYKWTDWRSYLAGDIVWHKGEAHEATSSGLMSATTRDSLAAIGSIPLSRVSGSGDTVINVSVNEGYSSSGNPIAKKFTNSVEGFNSPGYSLYDSDDCPYWIYLGWDEPEQRYVTRHQMNQVIDTSIPLFDNINSMLSQFNGVLRYSNGKYFLAVKQAEGAFDPDFEVINDADIIGSIKVTDKGQKDTFNSVTAQIIDPQNRFGGRSITFMNSDYLKEDKGIRRQGNFTVPGISNYYNARLNVKQYLDDSRFGLTVNFQIDQKGYYLVPGALVKLNYSRFNWIDKVFRINTINYSADGLATITADEHNNSSYLIANLRTSGGDAKVEGGNSNVTPFKSPSAPTGLAATTNEVGGITVTWANSSGFNDATHYVEVWASDTDDILTAELLVSTVGTRYVYGVAGTSVTSKYFWVRTCVLYQNKKYSSDYSPSVLGTAVGATSTVAVKLEAENYAVSYDAEGANPSPSAVQTLTATSQNFTSPRYRFTIDGVVGAWQQSNTSTYTPSSTYFGTPKVISVEVAEAPESGDPTNAQATDSISIFALKEGLVGDDALTFIVANEAHTVPSTTEGDVSEYTGSGTNIYLFEGVAPLQFIASGVPGNGEWTIATAVSPVDKITVGAITDAGNFATVGEHSSMDSATATVTISYTVTGKRLDGTALPELVKTQTITKSKQGIAGKDAVIADLTNEIHTVVADKDGNLAAGALLDATTTLNIFIGTTNDTDNWSVVTTVSDPGLSITGANTKSITVTGMTVDSATVTFTASKTGYADQIVIFSISKQKQGNLGDPAVVYRVNTGATAITLQKDGTFNPASLTPSATKHDGSTISAFTGGTLQLFRNGSTTPLTLTAGSWTVTSGTTTVKARLTVDSVVVDEENIFIVTDGTNGDPGSNTGTVVLYKPNTSNVTPPAIPNGDTIYSITSNTVDVGADGWTITKPGLSVGQYLWSIQKPYSTTATSITIASGDWSTPVVVDSNTKGDTGLKSAQGYLYYEKTTAGAPSAPSGTTYNLTGTNAGKVTGTGINDAGTTDVWKNSPNTQNATSSNTYYIIRYYGEQANSADTTITVAYTTSTGVVHTSFSGVVTFTNGTFSNGTENWTGVVNGGALNDIYNNYSAGDDTTHIDGGYIKTNTVDASQLVVSSNTDNSADSIYMGNGVIKIYGNNGSGGAVLRVKLGNLSAP